ncbi:unnamed protein product [Rhizophagus irregularis]|nr:unnamed protein product [Rhizophagus irregularis]
MWVGYVGWECGWSVGVWECLSSLYLGLLFIRSSFRPFSLRPPLGLLFIGFSFRVQNLLLLYGKIYSS